MAEQPPAGPEEESAREMAENSSLRAAAQRRTVFKSAIDKMLSSLEGERLNALTIAQIEERLRKLDDNWINYRTEHLTIMCETAIRQVEALHRIEYDALESQLELLIDRLRERLALLRKAEMAENIQPAASRGEGSNSNQRPIQIVTGDGMANIPNTWGKFTGEYSKWPTFRDCFEGAIHSSKELDDIQKFQYLIAAVTDRAQRAMGNFRLTAENYKRAWDRLCEVYEDDYQAVQELVRQLLQLSQVIKPSYDALSKIVDVVHGTLAQLETFETVKISDTFVVFLVIGRLDQQTYTAWETHRTSKLCGDRSQVGKTIPTWEQLKAFLDAQARVLMHSSARSDDSESSSSVVSHRSNKSGKARHSPYPQHGVAKSQAASTASAPAKIASGYPACRLCNADHALFRCPKFVKMELGARQEYIRQWKICSGCLYNLHPDRKCSQGPCYKCQNGKVHNSIICPTREIEKQTAMLALADAPAAEPKKSKKRGGSSKQD